MTVSEAAQMAGCSVSTMRRWLQQGRIQEASKDENGWQIPAHHLRLYLATQTPSVGDSRRAGAQSQAPIGDPSERLIERLEAQLKIEQDRVQKLEEENRQLNAEIRALLDPKSSSKLGRLISRWVRT